MEAFNIPERASQIAEMILQEPLVFMPLLLIWFIFELFYIISNDDNDVGEVDMLDNGISALYVSIMISPAIRNAGTFSIADYSTPTPRTVLSMILLAYSAFMITAASFKYLPKPAVKFLGGAGIDTFLIMMALIYIEKSVPIDPAAIIVVGSPMLAIYVVKKLRRLKK